MKVSVIIPVYNEARTIAEVLNRIAAAKLPKGFSKELIVVNDASTDSTPSILTLSKIKFKYSQHEVNRGKGAAILTGLSRATGDLVLIQDADMEYDPNDYLRLLSPFFNSKTRVVYGSRLIDYPLRIFGRNKTPLPLHLLANKALTFLTNLLYRSSLTDMETCYKVVETKLLKSLDIQATRFDFEPEVTAKLLKKGIKILEVPIKVKPRGYAQGKKIGWADGVMAIWTLFRYKLMD